MIRSPLRIKPAVVQFVILQTLFSLRLKLLSDLLVWTPLPDILLVPTRLQLSTLLLKLSPSPISPIPLLAEAQGLPRLIRDGGLLPRALAAFTTLLFRGVLRHIYGIVVFLTAEGG